MSKILSNKSNLQILYEDNHIIIINKRSGDIVQGDKTGDAPLSDIVKAYEVGIMRKQQAQYAKERMALRRISDVKFIEVKIWLHTLLIYSNLIWKTCGFITSKKS